MTYPEKLKHPKWQKKRLEILQRDKWHCKLCGDHETTLHIHHKQYTVKDIWDEPNKNLITLCEHCHAEIEIIKEEFDEFEEIAIYKSANWCGGSRIMFASYDGKLAMRIFDENNDYLCGYNFTDDLKALKKLILKALKDGEKVHGY